MAGLVSKKHINQVIFCMQIVLITFYLSLQLNFQVKVGCMANEVEFINSLGAGIIFLGCLTSERRFASGGV